MSNLAHFDPALQARNVSGMSHASRMDKEVVERFLSNWEDLVVVARLVESKLQLAENIEPTFPIGDERDQIVRQRVNQAFFRDLVLAAYHQKCCITGIEIVASYRFVKGRAYINKSQYFTNVRDDIWDFCFGGYHGLQKWFKDHKRKELSGADIKHIIDVFNVFDLTLKDMNALNLILEGYEIV